MNKSKFHKTLKKKVLISRGLIFRFGSIHAQKQKFPLLFLLLFTTLGYGQNKTYPIAVEKYEVLDSLNFNIQKLIDTRPEKSNIGIAQKGILNKKVTAVLPDSLPTYLEPILKEMVVEKPNQKSFEVWVHDLVILEHTGAMQETGYCKLQIEFVKDDLSYGFYDANIQNNGLDVTKGHGKRIAKAFASCFKEFNKNGIHKKGVPVVNIYNMDFQFPEKLPQGTYTSLSDVIRNQPDSLTLTPERIGGKKLERYVLKNSKEEILKKRTLLFSDGEHMYLCAANFSFDTHYLKAKHQGRYLYFEDRFTDPATASGVGAAMGAAFGLAGAFIGVAASNTKHGIVLDTKTGRVTVLTSKTIKTLLKDQPDLLEKYERTDKSLIMKELVVKELNKIHG